MRTLTEAYKTVFFGEIAPKTALNTIFVRPDGTGPRETLTTSLEDADLAAHDRWIWMHSLWVDGPLHNGRVTRVGKTGSYFTIGQMLTKDIRAMHPDERAKLRNRKGIRQALIQPQTSGFVEVDTLPMDEILANLDAFEAETGLRFGVVLLSGDDRPESIARTTWFAEQVERGKSPHGHMLYDRPVPHERWLRLQGLLCLALKGDPAVIKVGQPMRTPGVEGRNPDDPHRVRLQTVLRCEPIYYHPDEVEAKTLAYLSARGMDTTPQGVKAEIKAKAAKPRKAGKSEIQGPLSATGYTFAGRLKMDEPIRTINGTTTVGALVKGLAKGEQVKCYCPHHESQTPGGSSSILAYGDGKYQLTCWGCNTKWLIGGGTSMVGFELPPTAAPKEIDWSSVEIHMPTTSRYLPPFQGPKKRIVVLRADKGMGKTVRMREYRAHALQSSPNPRTVAVCHRRTLTRGLSGALELPNYQDLQGDITTDAAICLDSLHRVKYWGEGTDRLALLCIDEAAQTMDALRYSAMDPWESMRAYEALCRAMQRSDLLVLADADISDSYIAMYAAMAGLTWDDVELIEARRDLSEYDYHYYDSRDDQEALIVADLKARKPIVICGTFGPPQADAWAKRVEKEWPGARVTVCHRLRPAEGVENINDWIGNVDVLIYTPSLGTGVSIDVPDHFERVYVQAWPYVGTAQDVDQMAHRVRKTVTSEVHQWVSPQCSHPETDAKRIWENDLKIASDTLQFAARQQLENHYALKADGTPYNPELFALCCNITAHRRTWGADGGDLVTATKLYWDDRGYRITYHSGTTLDKKEKKKLAGERKESRQEVDREYAMAVSSAEVVGIETIRARENHTPQEHYEAEKAEIADFYGIAPEEVTVLRAAEDKRGKRRSQLRKLGQLALWMQGNRKAIAAIDAKRADAGSIAHMSHAAQTAWGMAGLLSSIPGIAELFNPGQVVDLLYIDQTRAPGEKTHLIELSPASLNGSVAFVRRFAAQLAERKIGVWCPVDGIEKVTIREIVLKNLKELGLGDAVVQTKTEGVRSYCIDPDKVRDILAETQTYQARLIEAAQELSLRPSPALSVVDAHPDVSDMELVMDEVLAPVIAYTLPDVTPTTLAKVTDMVDAYLDHGPCSLHLTGPEGQVVHISGGSPKLPLNFGRYLDCLFG